MRHVLLATLSICLLLAGCVPLRDRVGDDDDSAIGDDDTAADDDDAVGDDDDMWSGETEGTLTLMYSDTGGYGTGAYLSASFADVITPATPGYITEIPAGLDDCAISFFTSEELTGTDPGEYDYQSAGTLAISGGGYSTTIDPVEHEGELTYFAQIPDAEFTFGIDWEVTAPGDDFPGFSATLPMTDRLGLVEPSYTGAFFELPAGDFPVAWSGHDSSDAAVLLTFVDGNTAGAIIICLVNNDGSFTVPGSLIDQLPAQGSGSLVLEQYNYSSTTVGGRSLSLVAGSAVMATGMRL